MAEFPINEPITLRYLPELPKDIPLAGSLGGMYATAVEATRRVEIAALAPEKEQKWIFIPEERGFIVQHYPNHPIKGIPPVGLQDTWHNSSPAPYTPITLSNSKETSKYHINIVTKHGDGWIISLAPMGKWIGVDRFIGAPKGSAVEIVPEPIEELVHFPGWFVRRTSDGNA